VSSTAPTIPFLEVRNLSTTFQTSRGPLRAVAEVNLDLGRDETLAVVGESGSGKTVLSRTIMGLQARENVEVTGSVLYQGHQIVGASDRQLRELWGKEIAMVFQDPMTSLHPIMKVGKQISECYRARMGHSRASAKAASIEMLRLVGIPSPHERYGVIPGQLSGGMRQRVVIAIALACSPNLLLADEPTTGLDATIQAQILQLLSDLRAQRQMSIILVTHDLGVVAHNTDRIMVMYAGRVVESGTTKQIFSQPRMPYTEALLASTPSIRLPSHSRLDAIPGRPPDLTKLPAGCAFQSRCKYATERCTMERPPLVSPANDGHFFACWNPIGLAPSAAPVAAPTSEVPSA
jgi:oligopeptide/dipeptide ABC transporter ATP-binding protein